VTTSKTPNDRTPEATDQFQLIVSAVVDVAIFIMDSKGRVRSWNLGAERIQGYKASEIIGAHFSVFYPDPDLREGKPERDLQTAERQGHFEEEGWRLRKGGSRFWANVVITATRDEDGDLIGYSNVTRDFTERREHGERLRESEERFRMLIEGVPDYAIYMMDPTGKITTWNTGAERIKGYTASEIIGQSFAVFFTEEDVLSGTPRQILEMAARQGRSEQEGWRRRKDGTRFWVNALVTALRDKSGKLVGFSKITRDITERMQQQEALKKEMAEKEKARSELRKSEDSLRRLSLNLLRTQDEERRRIGREMHDSLGQYLSALKMKLGTLAIRDTTLSPEATGELAQCAALLDECVKEVRTISYLLYPPMLEEMGLKSAISWYLDGFAQRSGVKTTFEVSPDVERPSRDVELALFRVLQEALTNVHKHSGSTRADIRLFRDGDNMILEVRDYGKGLSDAVFDDANANWYGALGVGLRGMNERMRQLGGELSLAHEDPGTMVRAKVPMQFNNSLGGCGLRAGLTPPQME
jgi:PAS domain S-box-containing protein